MAVSGSGGFPHGRQTDAGRLEDFASLARQDVATARPADLVWLLHLAGYGYTAECRELLAEGGGIVAWPGGRVQIYVKRARERQPGGWRLWGNPDLRPANDWRRLRR